MKSDVTLRAVHGLDLIVHWLLIYIVWMLYTLLAMGVLESASDRTEDLRGAGTALVLGAVVGTLLTIVILWFGPLDPFASG